MPYIPASKSTYRTIVTMPFASNQASKSSRRILGALLGASLGVSLVSPTPALATSRLAPRPHRAGTPTLRAQAEAARAATNLQSARSALAATSVRATKVITRVERAPLTQTMASRSGELYGLVANSTRQVNATVLSAYTVTALIPPQLGLFSSIPQLQRAQAQGVYTQVVTETLSKRIRRAQLEAQQLNAQLATLAATLGAITAVSVAAMARQVSLELLVTSDTTAIINMDKRMHIALNGSLTSAPPGALTIQGPSVLNAAQLANWYANRGYQSSLPIPIVRLAQIYLDEAKAEGIRGDVAFIQATLETGGFAIMSGRYNFAGIGACDSCARGYDFSSLRMGVRAQIELLKAYADPRYSQATTARPSAYKWINTVPVKGTRQTWYSLGDSWSSDPAYGEHILALYLEALDLAQASTPVKPTTPTNPPPTVGTRLPITLSPRR